MRRGLALGLSLLAAASGVGPVWAAAPQQQHEAAVSIAVSSREARGDVATLRSKASASNGVRVFIKLNVPLQDEDRLSPSASEDQARTLAAAQSGVVARALAGGEARHHARSYSYIPYIAATVNAAELESLLTDGAVTWIGEVGVRRRLASSLPWGVDRIKVEDVWDRGYEGGGTTVSVLDAGMQASHPMISSNVVEEMCYSTMNPARNLKTLCPNGKEKMTGPKSSKNCPVFYGQDCQHGTHVAGIAAGRVWNGLSGVAPQAKLILGQVFTENTTTGKEAIEAYDDDIVSGLERVYSLRKKYTIAAVNLSLGGGQYDSACDTDAAAFVDIFRLLREAKIAPIVASGNEYFNGSIGKPACASGAIAVGATDKNDKVPNFSNHSQLVKMMAPGVSILSAAPGNGKTTMSGTSQATPHVSGAFAVLRSAVPGAQVAQIERALECTGKPVEDDKVSKRRIDVAVALEVLTSGTNKPKVFAFEKAADTKAWKPAAPGKWKVAGGSYVPVFAPADYDETRTFTPNCNSDLDVVIDLKGAGEGQEFSVMLKTQIDGADERFSGYSFAFHSYKNSAGSWTTLHAFRRFDQYNFKTFAGGEAFLYGDCGLPASGPVEKVEFRVRGGQIKVLENDAAIGDPIKDLTYTTGGIGLAVSPPYNKPNAIKFDKITITSRDKPLKEADPAALEAAVPAMTSALTQQIAFIKVPQC